MKQLLSIITILSLGAIVALVSCGKDDDVPVITMTGFTTDIDENPASGDPLGTVSGTSSDGASVRFSIASESVAGAFTVDELTGDIQVNDASIFDFETNATLSAVIRGSVGGVTQETDILVNLIDVTFLFVGNYDPTGFTEDPNFSANNLLGTKYTVSVPGELNGLGLIGRNTAGQVKMALYADNQGAPGDFVAETVTGTLDSTDPITLSINPPVNLNPGDYWVMAVYETTGDHTYRNTTSEETYYTQLAFGDPIPGSAANFQSYPGGAYTYYMSFTEQ